MARLWTCPSSFIPPSLQSYRYSAIPIPLISKTLIPKTLTRTDSSSASVSVLPSNCHRSLQRVCSVSSIGIESDTSPSNGVFIKGLPESATEGRLKKVFLQFGEVSQGAFSLLLCYLLVKVVVEKMYMQPLGSAFVWFTRKESAQLAVEEMNGKFFDGRFILVKIVETRLSKSRGKITPYRF